MLYVVEKLTANGEDAEDNYAIIQIDDSKARTVCFGVSSESEASKIAQSLIWYETFTQGFISLPPQSLNLKKPLKKHKRKKEL